MSASIPKPQVGTFVSQHQSVFVILQQAQEYDTTDKHRSMTRPLCTTVTATVVDFGMKEHNKKAHQPHALAAAELERAVRLASQSALHQLLQVPRITTVSHSQSPSCALQLIS